MQGFLGVDPLAGKFQGWSPYNYVLGNPISLVDPDGRMPAGGGQGGGWWDKVKQVASKVKQVAREAYKTTVAFTVGVGNGFGSSMLANAGRRSPSEFGANENAARNGQMIGDAGAIIVGALEAEAGIVAAVGGGGGTVATAGMGSPITVPIAVGGVVVATHGISAVITGATNLMAGDDNDEIDHGFSDDNVSRGATGKSFRGGKKNKRDSYLSQFSKKFKRWFHKQKDSSMPDSPNNEIDDLHSEWNDLGQPDVN